jgi:hypothetical protein
MGFTRARRYANHAGGRKYVVPGGKEQLPRGAEDPVKAEAASIFSEGELGGRRRVVASALTPPVTVLARVKADERYCELPPLLCSCLALPTDDALAARLLQEFSERWEDHAVPAPNELESLGLLEPKPDADSAGDDHDDDDTSDE